ncbi:MAG: FtsQ-type POTRA domain-containing protein [Nitrospirae bacterium]|nr:FtsQ-type POTRA domain-containing protein [Nitrospirota bacterium]
MNRRNIRTLQRKKEKRRLRFIIVPPLAIILLGLGIYSIAKNYIPVKEIVFIGNHHLKNEELSSLIKVKKNDGLFGTSGANIYSSLKRSPWIKDAVIRRELSGRMLIKVTERLPVAILIMSERPYLIDKEGYILEQIKEGTVLLLPVIKGIDPYRNKETYAEAVRFVRVLHDKRVLSYDGSVEITGQRPEDITLKLDRVLIKVGMGDFDKKLERLEFVKDEVQKRNMNVEYIDLRFANKIIVKPVSNAEGEVHAPSDKPVPKEQNTTKKR